MWAPVRVTLLVCSLAMASCASVPTHHDADGGLSTNGSTRTAVHESVFANLVAVVAAMGGNNPNPGYHAMTIKGCGPNARFLTGPQALDTRSSQTLQTATVSAPCPRIAALK